MTSKCEILTKYFCAIGGYFEYAFEFIDSYVDKLVIYYKSRYHHMSLSINFHNKLKQTVKHNTTGSKLCD
ncbi:MAG: hypothetical protein CMF49_09540 [Legionellales bacterium]|nr:hypothetical protein [Legionellales bacterium]|tara:strand:+ start:236 stop:445 length:210 start_codon:yes stop_codon:yes gene_type:complete